MVKIKLIISVTGVAWGYLFTEEKRREEADKFEESIKNLRFPNDLELEIYKALSREEEINIVRSLSEDDLVVYASLSLSAPGLSEIIKKGNRLVFYQKPYAGHVWMVRGLRRGRRVIVMSTDIEDLRKAILALYAVKKIEETRYILVTIKERKDILSRAERLASKFNFNYELVGPEVLTSYYERVAKEDAERIAKEVVRGSIGVIEPSFDEIVKSSRLYIAMKRLIEDRGASGITIDCLTLFSRGLLPAYPCIGFSLLNNEGIPAACEGDVYSLFMMFIYKYLAGLPSFISDPVIDTSRNLVIHAHCVAATKLDGVNESPYIIRSHAEDNKGASLEVKFERIGSVMTVANYLDGDRIAVSTGEVAYSPEINRACRTKIALKVKNVREMLENWPGGERVSAFGLHRVLAYGDRLNEIKHVAKFLGIGVIEEQ